jgi:hypothetical protein
MDGDGVGVVLLKWYVIPPLPKGCSGILEVLSTSPRQRALCAAEHSLLWGCVIRTFSAHQLGSGTPQTPIVSRKGGPTRFQQNARRSRSAL